MRTGLPVREHAGVGTHVSVAEDDGFEVGQDLQKPVAARLCTVFT